MAKPSKSAGNWLTTYSDFITLMMIFFIVMYHMTAGIKKQKFDMIIGAFQGRGSVLKNESVMSRKKESIQKKSTTNWNKLQKYIDQNKLNDQVQIDLLPDGIRIILGEALTFNSGSAIILDKSKSVLNEIAQRMDTDIGANIHEVEVEGYTDNVPISSDNKLFHTNWELGAARATAVLEYLIDHSTIPSDKFQATTFGQYRPMFSNNTEEGRKKNRRVEIYIRYNSADKHDNGTPDMVKKLIQDKRYGSKE